jgi:hypothetical protein
MINEEVRHSTQHKMMIMYIACSQERSENFRNMSTIPHNHASPPTLAETANETLLFCLSLYHSLLARGCILFRHADNTRVEQKSIHCRMQAARRPTLPPAPGSTRAGSNRSY